MNSFLVLLAAIASASTLAAKQDQAGPYTQIGTSGDTSEASNGRLRAKLLVVPDIDAFWKAWEVSTPPQIVTTDTITHAKPVHAVIVFSGCTPGGDGQCKLSVTFAVTAPDGRPYDKETTAAAWEGPAGGDHLLASSASFGFHLETTDQLGRYQMKATLTDEISRTSLTIRKAVVAVAASGR
ncbi:hypothetical protein [Sphingomonas sp.]|uniref:hypothetical protein n=1 Tax=Sphingomonas sp. TaxID=28214 RepID=UPI00286EA04D|nr:hypothetical protein [Sphingomonas sp.]